MCVCLWGAAIFIFVTRIRPVDPQRTQAAHHCRCRCRRLLSFVAESREHLKCYKFICDPQPEEQLKKQKNTPKKKKKEKNYKK